MANEVELMKSLHEEYDQIIAEIHNTVANHHLTLDFNREQTYDKLKELERATFVGKNAENVIN